MFITLQYSSNVTVLNVPQHGAILALITSNTIFYKRKRIQIQSLKYAMLKLFFAFTFAKTCALKLRLHTTAPCAGWHTRSFTRALHVQLQYIFGEGQSGPNG